MEINVKLVRRVFLLSLLSTRITQRKPNCISEQHMSFLSYKPFKPLSSTWAVYRSLRKCTEIIPWPTSASAAHW